MDPNNQIDLNQELKQKTIEALHFVGQEITQNYSTGKAFVIEQAPLVVQEMVRWGITESLLYVLLTGVVLFFCIRFIKRTVQREDADPEMQAAMTLFPGIAVLCLIFPFLRYLFILAQAIVAPRLFLLEQAAHLLKK